VDIVVLARTTGRDGLDLLDAVLTAPVSAGAGIPETLARLPRGEFMILQRDADHGPVALTFVAAPRQTVHVRHLMKYVDSCVPPGREFLFRRPDGRVIAAADSLQSFRHVVATVPDEVLSHHAGRGDFSRWIRDVFADAELARQLRKVEARWLRGELPDLRRAIGGPIVTRYGGEE